MNAHEEAQIREIRRQLAMIPNPPPWLRAVELLGRKVDELELELGLERLRSSTGSGARPASRAARRRARSTGASCAPPSCG